MQLLPEEVKKIGIFFFFFRSTNDVESPGFLQVACSCRHCLLFLCLKLAFLKCIFISLYPSVVLIALYPTFLFLSEDGILTFYKLCTYMN